MPTFARSLLALLPWAFLALAGCAAIAHPPANQPLPKGASIDPWAHTAAMHEHSIVLSVSGGGLRAAAFAHGVLKALASQPTPDGDLLDDVRLISSVSGSSITAAWYGLHGRAGLERYREDVLLPGLETDLSLSLTPWNLHRLLGAGLNGNDLSSKLDQKLFHGATFHDLHAQAGPEIRIHATALYHRIQFPFIPAAFATLCSDLESYPVADAVAASMSVPMLFAPVVLRSYPGQCEPTDAEKEALRLNADRSHAVSAIVRAIRDFRDPPVKYVKLADGGLTDNYAVNDFTITRLFMGTPYAPMTERDAVTIRRLLLVAVDASRPLRGEWLETPEGPEGIALGLAGMDSAIDSAARFASDQFDRTVKEWEHSVRDFRCGLSAERARELGAGPGWDCRAVRVTVAHLALGDLPSPLRERIEAIATRLALEPAEIDDSIEGGYQGTLALPELAQYLAERRGFGRPDVSRPLAP